MRALHAGWLVSLAEAARNHLGAVLSPPRRVLYDRTFLGAADAAATAGELAVLLLLAGRGFGKTRTGAETVRARVAVCTARRLALVAPTAADVRNVTVEDESGILAISPPWDRPR